jgi:hypothetical protein
MRQKSNSTPASSETLVRNIYLVDPAGRHPLTLRSVAHHPCARSHD